MDRWLWMKNLLRRNRSTNIRVHVYLHCRLCTKSWTVMSLARPVCSLTSHKWYIVVWSPHFTKLSDIGIIFLERFTKNVGHFTKRRKLEYSTPVSCWKARLEARCCYESFINEMKRKTVRTPIVHLCVIKIVIWKEIVTLTDPMTLACNLMLRSSSGVSHIFKIRNMCRRHLPSVFLPFFSGLDLFLLIINRLQVLPIRLSLLLGLNPSRLFVHFPLFLFTSLTVFISFHPFFRA